MVPQKIGELESNHDVSHLGYTFPHASAKRDSGDPC